MSAPDFTNTPAGRNAEAGAPADPSGRSALQSLSDLHVMPFPIALISAHDGWPGSIFYIGDHSHFAAAYYRDGRWYYASTATALVGTRVQFYPTYFLGVSDPEGSF